MGKAKAGRPAGPSGRRMTPKMWQSWTPRQLAYLAAEAERLGVSVQEIVRRMVDGAIERAETERAG